MGPCSLKALSLLFPERLDVDCEKKLLYSVCLCIYTSQYPLHTLYLNCPQQWCLESRAPHTKDYCFVLHRYSTSTNANKQIVIFDETTKMQTFHTSICNEPLFEVGIRLTYARMIVLPACAGTWVKMPPTYKYGSINTTGT